MTWATVTSIPAGVITMFSGSAVPSGWLLCDGTNDTPNLVDKFIRGTSTLNSTATGGTDTLSGSTGSSSPGAPGHTHSITAYENGGVGHVTQGRDRDGNGDPTSPSTANTNISSGNSAHTHTQSGSNIPAYYALAYIIKT